MSTSVADRRIRSLRSPKPRVDVWKAHGTAIDDERRPDGRMEQALTVFLAGSECPFTCTFCDLWQFTIDGPTPRGALPTQIADAIDASGATPDRIKLYNASNFFDRRAVPADDVPKIAELCAPFTGVTVESHASTIGPMTMEFADRLSGRLEVAVGLETIHPTAMNFLNKRLDLATFDKAARFLSDARIDLRVFVLLGAPYVEPLDSVEWAARTVEYAAQRNAAVVSIIPVRGGNGELERLEALGDFEPPTLTQLEDALVACRAIAPTVVTVDLWDVAKLPACPECRADRIGRLQRINVSGNHEPRIACPACKGQ